MTQIMPHHTSNSLIVNSLRDRDTHTHTFTHTHKHNHTHAHARVNTHTHTHNTVLMTCQINNFKKLGA